MGAYLAFVRSGFIESFAYRNVVWANIFGKLVQVFARVAIWLAAFAGLNATIVDGVSLQQMVTYALLGGLILGATRYDRLIRPLAQTLRTGDVAVWLLKPLHYPLYMMAVEAGKTFYTLLFAVVPTIVAGALVYGILPPVSLFHGAMVVPYWLLGFTIHFLCSALFGLCAFWLMTAFSLEWLLQSFITLLSGLWVPFWFFPEPWGDIARYQPLAWLVYYPSAVWLGQLSVSETWGFLVMGCGWVALLGMAVAALWNRATLRISVQGG